MRYSFRAFLCAICLVVPQQSFAGFIDWTSFSNPSGTTSVSGLLSGSAVTATISGTGGSARIYAPGSSINNTYSWTGSAHIPNLVNSDMLYFENLVANSVDTWTVSFSAPVENPVFLFKGLERTYSFDSGITLLSANTPGYIVSGNSITGNTFTPSNAGSLQLFGTYTSLMIVGTGITGGDTHNRDAVLVQIGATPYVEPPPPPPPPPEEVNEPSMLTPLMLGLFLIATRLRIRQRQ